MLVCLFVSVRGGRSYASNRGIREKKKKKNRRRNKIYRKLRGEPHVTRYVMGSPSTVVAFPVDKL